MRVKYHYLAEIGKLKTELDTAQAEIERLTAYCSELAETVEQRASELREARRETKAAREITTELNNAIAAGGWDMSPCGECGTPVVCLPDGLPCCELCATQSGA